MHLSQFPHEYVIPRSKINGLIKFYGDKNTKTRTVDTLIELSHLIITSGNIFVVLNICMCQNAFQRCYYKVTIYLL